MEIRDSSNKYFLSWTRLFSSIFSVCLCLHGFLKGSGFYFVLLVLFSSYSQRRTLSSSPCCYSFWRKMLHCIAVCCWSTSMRLEIHGKDSAPVLSALQPHPAESSPWGTQAGSPEQAVRWWFLGFESATSTYLMSKRHIRHWFTSALQLSQTGVQDSWALSPWSKVPCPEQAAAAKQSLQKPPKVLLQFAYKQDSALQKILHFIS